ncbi:MAG TPA: pilin [bacterium]|jgi:hypothetical protein|nr:pilin [bacterium]HOG38592.1 pilin [bacterium]
MSLLKNKKNIILPLLIFIIFLNFCFISNIKAEGDTTSNAEESTSDSATSSDDIDSNSAGVEQTFNMITNDLDVTAGELQYNKSKTGILQIIIGIISAVLAFLGVIIFILIIFNGFQWMTAGGDEEKVKKSKEAIKNAVIGLAIILCAYVITQFILSFRTSLNV